MYVVGLCVKDITTGYESLKRSQGPVLIRIDILKERQSLSLYLSLSLSLSLSERKDPDFCTLCSYRIGSKMWTDSTLYPKAIRLLHTHTHYLNVSSQQMDRSFVWGSEPLESYRPFCLCSGPNFNLHLSKTQWLPQQQRWKTHTDTTEKKKSCVFTILKLRSVVVHINNLSGHNGVHHQYLTNEEVLRFSLSNGISV